MSRRDFLIEIGTEELPPLALQDLADAFATGIAAGLTGAQLKHGRVQRFATPRRLAVLVKGVVEQQPEQEIKRRGPPVSASFDPAGLPTRAALAFAESCGTKVEALQRITEPKGEFLFFSGRRPGAQARDLLAGVVQAALDSLPIPRRMRWGSSDVQFVRPVHWVLMLFGSDTPPTTILGLPAGRTTQGHRFHAPKPLRISSPGSYLNALRNRGRVLADFAERRERIRAGVTEMARSAGGEALLSNALLDEVAALVEWPVPLLGRFEARFLELPREVLIATLQDHQRYFAVQSADGAAGGGLLPLFIAVSNIDSREPSQVRAGNERVVRPRLTDAAFFFDTDRKQPLAARCADLAKVTYQTKLGTLADKTARVSELAARIAAQIGASPELTRRAAQLCKCDLLSLMVGEFPELQGIMGRYYAQHDREPAAVAEAIAEHYLPRFSGDALPATGEGMALAIADKLDTIAGIFAIDQKPSGTRDPFGVRRAALGLLRILLEKRLELDLKALVAEALLLVRAHIAPVAKPGEVPVSTVQPDPLSDAVYAYIMERLRSFYLGGVGDGSSGGAPDRTITTEIFDAVLSNNPSSPLDFDARLSALEGFLKLEEATSLAAANKRIVNILRKAPAGLPLSVRPELLRIDAERQLHTELEQVRREVEPLLAARRYTDAMQRLARLRSAVDLFFDVVMVMDEDAELRGNRLALLRELRQLFLHTADLSRLPG